MLSVPPRSRVKIRRRVRALALACAVAGGGAAGCADFARVTSLTPVPVADSAVAGEVAAASRRDYPTPSFRDVPPKPENVPPPESFRTAVTRSVAARERQEAWVAANPPMVQTAPDSTEAFAASQRARIPAGQTGSIPDPAGSEEYAARLRELATPPPQPR